MGTDRIEEDFSLLDGESLDSTLDLKEGLHESSGGRPNVVLLTDRRVIHVFADGRRQRFNFASLGEVESAEIFLERVGKAAYIWAALAFLAAFMLTQVIDHPVGSATAAAAVGLMGVYLIFDKLKGPATSVVVFKGGASQFQVSLQSEKAAADAPAFVNRLYALKETRKTPSQPEWDSPDEIFPPC